MRFAAERSMETITVMLEAGPARLRVRRDGRAKRIILRVDSATGDAVLTLPARTGLAAARAFAEDHRGWLAARLDRLPPPVPFKPGVTFPFRGEPHLIAHRPGRGLVRLDPAGARAVIVPGQEEHLPRRLTEWLRRQARSELAEPVTRFVAQIGGQKYTLRIGDAKSRWGSCSARGTLTFSWRLILAPPDVLTYLAAHEVAHLREMNHGPRFWRLVADLDPDYAGARSWLKRHGPKLHAVGRSR